MPTCARSASSNIGKEVLPGMLPWTCSAGDLTSSTRSAGSKRLSRREEEPGVQAGGASGGAAAVAAALPSSAGISGYMSRRKVLNGNFLVPPSGTAMSGKAMSATAGASLGAGVILVARKRAQPALVTRTPPSGRKRRGEPAHSCRLASSQPAFPRSMGVGHPQL